ncbi:MAG: hypothetical protein KF851_13995 [Pirellulaceae bacterium]|nr:hypothetical protein [Pirellulaceae bacterium]
MEYMVGWVCTAYGRGSGDSGSGLSGSGPPSSNAKGRAQILCAIDGGSSIQDFPNCAEGTIRPNDDGDCNDDGK